MHITKVTKCKCLNSIWNLKPGDITNFKIVDNNYHFEAKDNDGNILWDTWGDDLNNHFLKQFELIDPDELNELVINNDLSYLIPFLKENNIV